MASHITKIELSRVASSMGCLELKLTGALEHQSQSTYLVTRSNICKHTLHIYGCIASLRESLFALSVLSSLQSNLCL